MSKMRQWSALTVVAVLVVFAAGWFMLVKPQKSKVASLKAETTTQESSNQQLLTQISSLQAEQKELPAQQLALQKFSTEVPDNAAEPTLIRQLSAAAQGSGVELISMTPGSATALTTAATATPGATTLGSPGAGSLTDLPISVGIAGSYANIESFFQSLERFPRAVLVSGWSLCPLASAAGASAGGGSSNCTPPSLPSTETPPAGTLGATVSANVFYSAPPAVSQTTPAATTGTSSTTTTPGTTTPTTSPTTAATTASSTAATSATTS